MIKVLIIEDDEIDRLAYQRHLGSQNFEIIERAYGRGAVEFSKQVKPDCIIVDYHLPDIRADELIKQFQADKEAKNIPIIVLTGQGNEETAVNTLKLGAKDYMNKANLSSSNLGNKIKQVINELHFETKLQNEYAQIKYMASHDHLTGLANRANFDQKVELTIQACKNTRKKFSIFFIDLNKFKPINDEYGHEYGDAVLVEVAKRLKAGVRSDDLVARLGGDEFGALLTDTKDFSAIGRKAQSLINAISEPYHVLDKELYISASIGISCFPDSARHAKSLLKCADVAMYKAKSVKQGAYRFYEESLSKEITKLNSIKTALEKSFSNQELGLAFQPVRQAPKNQLVALKAYIMWDHEHYSNLTSNIIKHYADQVGLMEQLAEWMLQSALFQLHKTLQENKDFKLLIPITTNLLTNASFTQMCKSVMARYHLNLNQLHFILKENCISARNKHNLIDAMRNLHREGVEFGFNEILLNELSLLDLADLPVNALYIDKSTISGLNDDKLSQQMADCISHLARIFNFKVYAEGIKTSDEIEYLKKLSSNFCYIEYQPGLVKDFFSRSNEQAQG